jgi:Tol biopolymer transport system component
MSEEVVERLRAAVAGRYRIERELGRGGMGIVYLAADLRHSRQVAIKVLRPDIGHHIHADRFLREIRIAAQLQHPNVLALIDSGEADGCMYYVMPYVAGESLRVRLGREHELPIDEALEIARQIAGALQHAHDCGVIHRDVKPENILLSSRHVYVMDFGVAHAVGQAGGERLTETGVALGTPVYMSPEQAGGTGAFDHRADIYSLGVITYEMLAGSTPFTGSWQVVLARKASEPAPGIRVVRETVPPHVEHTVLRALSRVPADRFATAGQFADALARDTRPVVATAPWSSRRRWLLAGAAGAVVIAGGAYALTAGRPWAGATTEQRRFDQLTAQPGVEWFPSLSPDGRWLVYSGEESGNRDIYLQSIGGQTAINLTKDSPAADDQPAFSHDGQLIAFRSSRDGGGIFVMGRTGESVRRLTSRGYRPTWSPDGSEIAFATEDVDMNPGNSQGTSEIWIVGTRRTSEPRRLPIGDAVLPAWSPNGHRIAFMRRLGLPSVGDIVTTDPNGTGEVFATRDQFRDWSPVWSRDGRYLYFSSDRGGSMNLWRVPIDERTGRTSGPPEPVTTPATYLAHPTTSAGGRDVAYTSALVTINVQQLELDPVTGTVRGEPTWVTKGTRRWSSPDPSPDGEWVAFYSLAQPEGHLYIARARDGENLRRITGDSGVADRVPRWSPDGQWLAYFSNRAGALHLWKIRTDGSGLQRLSTTLTGPPAWSPDGTRIAASGGAALDDSSVTQVFDVSRPFDEQQPQVLPRTELGAFFVNSWSPDGEKLAGQLGRIGGLGKGLAIYSLRSQRYEKLTDFGEWPVWLPDSRRVLFVAHGNALHVVDALTKETRQIYSTTRDVIGPPRLSRDGRYVFLTRRVTEADVWLMSPTDRAQQQ